jgi:hypothetical protein
MKIAFCFLTLDNLLQPAVWERFFAAAPPAQRNIYCHPKYPAQVENSLLKSRIIDEIVVTSHGDATIVEAALALYTAAYLDDVENEYFILLSESTIPIVAFAEIYAALAQCGRRSVIPFWLPAPNSEHYRRLGRTQNPALFTKAFYCHDNWFVLHRRHIALLLDRSPLSLFDGVFGADEHYAMNVLVHLKNVATSEVISAKTTFVNWAEGEQRVNADPLVAQIEMHNWADPEMERAYRSDPKNFKAVVRTAHPKIYRTLTEADLAAAKGFWFFRKLAATCNCDLVLPRLGVAAGAG